MSGNKFAGFARLFSVLTLTFGTTAVSATTTYAVGTCRPGLHSFPTISDALAATPSANVIVVCPGTYNEQVQITQAVTLAGVSDGTSAQAIIAPPASGLVTNATSDFGSQVAAQLWVNNAPGPVNISDLTVDASGNGVSSGVIEVAGIFYQNSSGTVNRVATRNQSGNNGGVGIWAEGGSANPLVTIENNSVHDYDFLGIFVETVSATPELTAVIKGNEVTTSQNAQTGIVIDAGSASTVTSNVIVNPGRFAGIMTAPSGSVGSISANTVANGNEGIVAAADGISVTSNKISGMATKGIVVETLRAAIQSNTIAKSTIGIDFQCNANPNVHSNIITDAGTGLNFVPAAIGPRDTFFNVGTIRTGGC